MIYGGQIERVERLGELMGCQVYYSKVNTIEGKAKRVRAWRREAVRRYSWESEDEGDEGSEYKEDKDKEDEDEEDEDEEEGEGSNDGVWENNGTEDSEAVEKERNNIEGKMGAEEIQDFVEARIERVWEMGQEVKERREIYKKVGDFQEQLASWVRCYVICRFSGAGRSEWYYEKEECK
ncbi:hypothetical protein QBC42DRAFT_290434 [Cladorrhinum samala]|uniref:Uncharacterized protein n=1 Tax=Cladorrhinum samala TaxID=585594 RepID=A0AAV9HC04_9PEZI|nr:hypothetical protein QBC42DRAFT_290434 [Cladorrhinum samala]